MVARTLRDLPKDLDKQISRDFNAIIKKFMSIEEQEFLRNDLTVKPFVPKNSLIKPQSFRVYRESTYSK